MGSMQNSDRKGKGLCRSIFLILQVPIVPILQIRLHTCMCSCSVQVAICRPVKAVPVWCSIMFSGIFDLSLTESCCLLWLNFNLRSWSDQSTTGFYHSCWEMPWFVLQCFSPHKKLRKLMKEVSLEKGTTDMRAWECWPVLTNGNLWSPPHCQTSRK